MLWSKWILVIASSSLFIISDSLSAHWGKTGSVKSLLFLIPLAPLGYLLFGLLNRKMSLGASASLVNLMIVLGAVLIGKLYFHEMLTIPQYVGIIFAIMAIALIS